MSNVTTLFTLELEARINGRRTRFELVPLPKGIHDADGLKFALNKGPAWDDSVVRDLKDHGECVRNRSAQATELICRWKIITKRIVSR